MRKVFASACVIAGCLVSLPVTLSAQEVIHALTGTVSSINSAAHTITVFQDTGSKGVFQDLANPKTPLAFDKRVAAETTAANSFEKQGAYAIIFYYGENDDRTVVALKSLGAGPFASTTGTVTRMDSHAHTISVRDQAGAEHTFRIDNQTVAEGGTGAIPGLKFDAHEGDHVRVVSSTESGAPVALFLRDI